MAGWAVVSLDGKFVKHDRHIVYAMTADLPQPPEPRCLDEAVGVLQQYGRRLDRSGEFVTAVSESVD
jgi:hypothetical protein